MFALRRFAEIMQERELKWMPFLLPGVCLEFDPEEASHPGEDDDGLGQLDDELNPLSRESFVGDYVERSFTYDPASDSEGASAADQSEASESGPAPIPIESLAEQKQSFVAWEISTAEMATTADLQAAGSSSELGTPASQTPSASLTRDDPGPIGSAGRADSLSSPSLPSEAELFALGLQSENSKVTLRSAERRHLESPESPAIPDDVLGGGADKQKPVLNRWKLEGTQPSRQEGGTASSPKAPAPQNSTKPVLDRWPHSSASRRPRSNSKPVLDRWPHSSQDPEGRSSQTPERVVRRGKGIRTPGSENRTPGRSSNASPIRVRRSLSNRKSLDHSELIPVSRFATPNQIPKVKSGNVTKRWQHNITDNNDMKQVPVPAHFHR